MKFFNLAHLKTKMAFVFLSASHLLFPLNLLRAVVNLLLKPAIFHHGSKLFKEPNIPKPSQHVNLNLNFSLRAQYRPINCYY